MEDWTLIRKEKATALHADERWTIGLTSQKDAEEEQSERSFLVVFASNTTDETESNLSAGIAKSGDVDSLFSSGSGSNINSHTDGAIPIIVTFHGYGGVASSELSRWKSLSTEFILVAPEGSHVQEPPLGWNAVDCCGDAVTYGSNDLSFFHGIVRVLSLEMDTSRVIVAGFSNGGFFASLIGLQQERPPWLKAIVPAGGYQYDTELYQITKVDPLPIFMHHAEKDVVVKLEGCCVGSENNKDSNCPIHIGEKRDTCLPAIHAFAFWSTINKCKSEMTKENEDTICRTGVDCLFDTKFCVWKNESHNGRYVGKIPNASRAFIHDAIGKSSAIPLVSGSKAAKLGNPNVAFLTLSGLGIMLICMYRSLLLLTRTRQHKTRADEKKSGDDMTELVALNR